MSTRDSLLVAFVTAVMGVGAGFLFASALQDARPAQASEPGGARPPSSPVSPSSSAGRSSSPAPILGAPAGDGERALAVGPRDAPTPRVPEQAFEQALDAVAAPAVAVARGDGSITGTVLDAAGAPIEGVVVVGERVDFAAVNDPVDVGRAPPDEKGLEEVLRARAESWAESRGSRRRVLTGADGGFALAGLAEGASYRVNAYLEDHVLEAEGAPYSVSPGQRLTFHAQAVHVIPVRLVHEDGRPADEGVVGVERGDRERYFAWSAGAPDLRLTAGHVGVRGYAGVRRTDRNRGGVDSTHASKKMSVDVVAQAGTPLDLVVKARCGIRGRLVDDFGMTGGRVTARLLPVAAVGEVDESALADSDRYTWLSGGRFQFLDLDPGTYAVGLSNWNEALLAHEVVAVGEGVVDVELVVAEPDPEEHLVVRAFGPTGSALRDLEFRWESRHGRGSRSGGIQGRRAADDAYWLQPRGEFFEPWGPETSFVLTVTHSELGDREIELVHGQREVTVHYEEPVSIAVVVAGYVDSGYEGRLQVDVAPAAADTDVRRRRSMRHDRRDGEGQLSSEGVARFGDLAPGVWEVSLQVKTGEWQTRHVRTVEVRVTSGEETVTIDLPALYDVVVVAPGLEQDSRLHLRPADGADGPAASADAQVDAEGRAVFVGLVAGEYVLNGSGMLEPVDVTVPSADVYLDARPPDSLRVAIGDMEGALYRAGLRAGDLIVGADGEGFESAPNPWELLRGEGELRLSVLRGGERLDLTMERLPNGADWFTRLGGMLRPARRP